MAAQMDYEYWTETAEEGEQENYSAGREQYSH